MRGNCHVKRDSWGWDRWAVWEDVKIKCFFIFRDGMEKKIHRVSGIYELFP